MRFSPAVLLTVVGASIIAACGDNASTTPRAIAPDRADAVLTPAASCDAGAIKTAARAYFTSSQDSAFNYDQALQKAYNGGLDSNATNVGWQIGRVVAKERLTSATATGSAGATYLIDVMRCMSDLTKHVPYPPLPIPDKFITNGGSALTSGIWEVRGGGGVVNSGLPAAGRVMDHTLHTRNFGLPRWGAEAQTSLSWPGATQYAVYGYPTNVGSLVIGANIDTNEVAKNAFELGTIPDSTSKAGIRVGVCVSTDNSGVVTRIVHNSSEILDSSTLTDLCDGSFLASAPAAGTWYANFLHRAGRILAPSPAFAEPVLDDCTDCIGGLPSGWSPFGTGAITASSVALADTVQPHNTVVDTLTTNDSLVVRATIKGLPLIGVSINSIVVENNKGTIAGAVITKSNLPVTTDARGMATVKFAVGKAGGYLITVSGTLDSFPTQSVTSTLFNVKNP